MKNPPGAMYHVYRFHELVAVSPPKGPTIYLTPTAARQLARALNRRAWDVGAVAFTDSNLGTSTISTSAQPKRKKS